MDITDNRLTKINISDIEATSDICIPTGDTENNLIQIIFYQGLLPTFQTPIFQTVRRAIAVFCGDSPLLSRCPLFQPAAQPQF